MNLLALLKQAREIITDPSAWTTGAAFRNTLGHAVDHPADASCFCSLGALSYVQMTQEVPARSYYDAMFELRGTLYRRGFCGAIAQFNDASTHAAVLGLFDETIQRLEQA